MTELISDQDIADIQAQLDHLEFGDGSTLDEGGGLGEFDFRIDHAQFGGDAAYNQGNTTLLKLTGQDLENDKERTILWSVGSKFEPTIDGRRAEHVDNPKRNFHAKSTIGQHIMRMTRNPAFPGVIQSAKYWSTRDFRDASSWEGLTLRFGDVEMLKLVDGVEEKKIGHGPTAFISSAAEPENGKPANGKPAKGAGKTKEADKDAAMQSAFAAIAGDRQEQITQWAKSCDNNTEFLSGAKTVAPELLKDKELAGGVFSGKLLAWLKGK